MFYLTTLSTGFGISAFSRNRFDLTNTVNILSTLIRVVLIVVLFNAFQPRVWHVGVSMLIAVGFSSAAAYCIWKHVTPMLELRMTWFSLSSLRQMMDMGWWIVINSLGTLLYLSIDLLVVNRILGYEATGQYGAVMTWATLLRSFAGVVAGVFGPTIIILYTRADMPGLVRYSRQAVKFLGLIMAVVIGLISGFSKPLLGLWLGPSYVTFAPLMALMTIHLCVNLAVLPLFSIQVATNHVRLPGMITCGMGLLNLILAVILVGPVGWGMYGVAVAGAITLTAKNVIFTPLYAAHILKLSNTTFCRELIPIVATTTCLAGVGWLVTRLFCITNWPALLAAGLVSGVFAAGAIYRLLLTNSERSRLVDMMRQGIGAMRQI
jgi:membrane protein EpsK